jgi:pro-apoptotic serine protease NMA111
VEVEDLHRITPSDFVEYSGGVFHNVSYHIAHSFGISVSGVFVANPGYALALAELSRFCLIQAIDGVATPTIEDFIRVLTSLPNGKRVSVKFCYLHDLHRQRLTVLSADRKWFAFRKASRNDVTGVWDYQTLLPSDSSSATASMITAKPLDVSEKMAPAHFVAPSFCVVNCRLPFLLDGCGNDAYIGLGLVASKKYGLVICDRGTVPLPLSDIHLTFSNTSVVSARCIFIHPIQNFCVLQFDPSLLPPDSPIQETTFCPTPILEPGENVYFVGMSASSVVVCRQTRVTAWAPIYVAQGVIPKYRPYNFETFGIQAPAPGIIGGVIANTDGAVRGIWATFTGNERAKTTVEVSSGIGVDEVCRVLDIFKGKFENFEKNGADSSLSSSSSKSTTLLDNIRFMFAEQDFGRVMDFIELYPISIAAAKALGLSDTRIAQLQSLPMNRNQTVLQIIRKSHLNPVADLFCEGDMVVAVKGETVCRFRQVYDAVVDKEEVNMTIVRDKKEVSVCAKTSILNGMPFKRAVGWSGALFQEPHAEVAHFSKEIPTQIYVCWVDSGSPAEMCRLYDNSFIMEVNGNAVYDLDDFIREISGCPDGTYVRLKVMDAFRSTVKILAIRVQSHYFPVYEASQATAGESVKIKMF